jgi:hypothetical protein
MDTSQRRRVYLEVVGRFKFLQIGIRTYLIAYISSRGQKIMFVST